MRLDEERNKYDLHIYIIKLNEGSRSNQISLGKTGKSQIVGANQVRGSDLRREEFIAENMHIYDNDGNPHGIAENSLFRERSNTIEILRATTDVTRELMQLPDAGGSLRISALMPPDIKSKC